jgi:adenylosuccinate lyase
MHEALKLLRPKLVEVLRHLSQFSEEYKDLPCLGFTHLQAAQPTTVGKRACLWLQDLMVDLDDLEEQLLKMRFLGIKGATGTQASFLELFHGDKNKVQKLDELVASEMGFSKLYTIASQTYPRKQDIKIIAVLSGIAASAHKFATDIRLLAHMKEVEEPFGDAQVGSSAMPYKRNPMRCERICGLARFLFSLAENPAHTAANQWLERTLDDSSNRRLVIPEAFLVADAILNLLVDVTAHLIVHPKVIQKHLMEELPFLISENILMAAVKKGKDRGTLHERLRLHSLTASRAIKIEGKENNFITLVAEDPSFGLSSSELSSITSASHFTGLASSQVETFLSRDLHPLLKKYHDLKPYIPNIHV